MIPTRLFAAVSIALTLLLGYAAHAASEPLQTDLVVNSGDPQHAKKIGEVVVWNDAQNLYVRFQIDNATPPNPSDTWCLKATHLRYRVGATGAPLDQSASLDCETQQTYTLPMTLSAGTQLFINASADAMLMGGLESLTSLLPLHAVVNLRRPEGTPQSYFEATISQDSFLNGTYPSWCVDTRHRIHEGQDYHVIIYSTYGELPAGAVNHPEHLDRVNWLINQGFVGKLSPSGLGAYTYGDVQRSIWELLDNDKLDLGLGDWNQNRVNELITLALAQGQNFKPMCDQSVAILLFPVDNSTLSAPPREASAQATVLQSSLSNLKIPCSPASATAATSGSTLPCSKKACVNDGYTYLPYTATAQPALR